MTIYPPRVLDKSKKPGYCFSKLSLLKEAHPPLALSPPSPLSPSRKRGTTTGNDKHPLEKGEKTDQAAWSCAASGRFGVLLPGGRRGGGPPPPLPAYAHREIRMEGGSPVESRFSPPPPFVSLWLKGKTPRVISFFGKKRRRRQPFPHGMAFFWKQSEGKRGRACDLSSADEGVGGLLERVSQMIE